MTCLTDLPLPAVKRLINLARGSNVPGTNGFARVCRRWREASHDSNDAEPLRLFLDVCTMSKAELSRATAWLSQHGQHASVLVLGGSTLGNSSAWTGPPALLIKTAATALSSLAWLEIGCEDSLAMVAPVLGQLPQLQHLAAHVGLDGTRSPARFTDDHGMFWEDLPDLQQLCPQLVSFQLVLDPYDHGMWMDDRLPKLLPAGLQRLALVSEPAVEDIMLSASSLTHLSALQQLTLRAVGVDKEGACALVHHLTALQQLRVSNIYAQVGPNNPVSQLASKVTGYELCPCYESDTLLPGLVCTWDHGERLPEGTAKLLGDLTGLQELSLHGFADKRMRRAVQQAAGMPTLRGLQLVVADQGPAELGASLGQCTQLTSLQLLVISPVDLANQGVYVSALQQLTGLRCLTVHAPLLAQPEPWLAALTNLTRLHVTLHDDEQVQAVYRGARSLSRGWGQVTRYSAAYDIATVLLQRVCAWPSSLRQVVVLVDRAPGSRNFNDQFGPLSWVLKSAAADGAQIKVWLEWCDGSGQGWSRPWEPAPHLPGVWVMPGRSDNLAS
jgi:hypothetical protein